MWRGGVEKVDFRIFNHWTNKVTTEMCFNIIHENILININVFPRYDHLRKEASDYQPADTDRTAEPWRSSIENAISNYRSQHYKNGVVTVYSSSSGGNITIIACLESHQFQPKNFW